jgi:hypothetical protein
MLTCNAGGVIAPSNPYAKFKACKIYGFLLWLGLPFCFTRALCITAWLWLQFTFAPGSQG